MEEIPNEEAEHNLTMPIDRIDVRGELKKKLTEEFTAALAAQVTLTESQRAALVEVIDNEQLTEASILQILSAAEENNERTG